MSNAAAPWEEGDNGRGKLYIICNGLRETASRELVTELFIYQIGKNLKRTLDWDSSWGDLGLLLQIEWHI
jgi:hypothetical protein